MKIVVSGASGLIGSALVPALLQQGHQITKLVRGGGKNTDDKIPTLAWDPERGVLDEHALAGHEVAVHLSGETVAERWNEEKKARIRTSRVRSTELIAEKLAQLSPPPRALLCASAVGYYGDRGDELLDEESTPGRGFLAEVCQEWEAAAEPARAAGIRVVHLRFGIVLSAGGGALAKMLTPFKLGVGGQVGDGKQWISWAALHDAVEAVKFLIARDDMRGPVNIVSPHPVTNAEFTETLGRVLSRPTFISVPAFGARLVFGEMADAALLSSARVLPRRLEQAQYEFAYPQLEGALAHLLK